TTGDYILYGKKIRNSFKLSQQISFVFQNPELQFVTNSVCEEIAYSLRIDKRDEQEIADTVEELLQLFHLTTHRDKHPFQLSMGQKRRLSVAASIIRDQQILLLDEPTFGLDLKNTFALLTLLEKYRQKNKTIMMVTHDSKIEEYFATRVWTIESGRLIKDQIARRSNVNHSVVSV